MRRKHNDDRYFKCELESESERESEIAGRRVASKARSEPSERERERRSDSPPTGERERERDDRDGRTTRRRENGGKVRRSIGIEIESQEFFIRATLHGARIARNPRGATARPSRQGAAPTPDPILRGV